MDTKYYVMRTLHNSETGAEDYQKPDSFSNLNDAKKKFHEYLQTFIGYGKLDRVAVVILDSALNIIQHEMWVKIVEPEEVTE